MKHYKVLALIPARSGSKSIPHKNIRLIGDKPMMAYSIQHALESQCITRTIVSTDSSKYAEIALTYGAEVPFIRPDEIAQDYSTDLEVFLHALQWLEENEGYIPEICVHLRPTHPIRNPNDIDKIVKLMIDNQDLDCIRTISLPSETPFKMWYKGEGDLLQPVIKCEINEAYNMPRQKLPQVYVQNACIDVIRTEVIRKKKSMTGNKIMGYVMKYNFDIDHEEQIQKAEEYIASKKKWKQELKGNKPKTFCFDIDGVIATLVKDNDYNKACPQKDMINIINELYKQGHRIILFTARGSATGINWIETTKKQMQEWGIRYHELLFGKPAADYYIDDKMVSIEQLKEIVLDTYD